MKYLIFLDDERNIEDVTWINYPEYDDVFVVRRMCDFIFVVVNLENIGDYDFSFDHDIQDFSGAYGQEQTGYDCAKWLCDYVLESNIDPQLINFKVHSQNPIGKQNIESYINNFKEFMKNV